MLQYRICSEYLPSSGGIYAVPKQRGFGRKIMIVERILYNTIEKVGLGNGYAKKTFTDHQLTDVFTKVEEC